MKFKNGELDISKESPFQNDVLDRKEIAINLTEFFSTLDSPFVLSISSPWGTGKTTFVRMLHQHLLNQEMQSLYFNAWESDFTDPLVGFISEIEDQLVANLEKGVAKQKFEQAKKISLSILKRALPVAIKHLTIGILDLEKLTEEMLSKIAEELTKAGLEEFKEAKNLIAEFKVLLGEFAEAIEVRNNTPIVIFIDELDRCKPSYAIALLERVKHILNVPGFVLSW